MRAETMLISTQTACAEQCACAGQRTHLGSRPKNGQAVLGGAPAIMLTFCFNMYRETGHDRRTTLKMEGRPRAGVAFIFSGLKGTLTKSSKKRFLFQRPSTPPEKSKLLWPSHANLMTIAGTKKIGASPMPLQTPANLSLPAARQLSSRRRR